MTAQTDLNKDLIIEDLVLDYRAGRPLPTGGTLAARHGIGESTGRRWLSEAKKRADAERPAVPAERVSEPESEPERPAPMGAADKAARGWSRPTAIAVTALVGVLALAVSAVHIFGVTVLAGQPVEAALLFPAIVDGAILVGALGLTDARRRGAKAGPFPRLALAFGVGATVVLNVASAYDAGPASMCVAALPAVAWILTFEALLALLRPSETS